MITPDDKNSMLPSKLLQDYNIAPGSTIKLLMDIHGGGGGGKVMKGHLKDKVKQKALDRTYREIEDGAETALSLAQTEEAVANLRTRMNTMLKATNLDDDERNPLANKPLTRWLKTMDKTKMTLLLAELSTTTNMDYRMRAIARALFDMDMHAIEQKVQDLQDTCNTAITSVRYAYDKEFAVGGGPAGRRRSPDRRVPKGPPRRPLLCRGQRTALAHLRSDFCRLPEVRRRVWLDLAGTAHGIPRGEHLYGGL
jgi:hypothetical protein